MSPQTVIKKLSERLIAIPNSMDDVSEMVENNLTEVQSQNKASLTKTISFLGYLVRQRLPLRRNGNDQDSNFKQLFKV